MTYNLRVKGNLTINVGGTTRIYAKEGVEINSNGKIEYFAESYSYGEPEEPPQLLNLKPKKIKFRPSKISPSSNIIAVLEQIDDKLNDNDVIKIKNNEIKDNWITVNGKFYLIPNNLSFFGTTLFKINDNLFQPVSQISNCNSYMDYRDSIDEQMQILKELIIDIELSDLKYKDQIKDRLSHDAYYRLIKCLQEIEYVFSETSDNENIKKWIIEITEN